MVALPARKAFTLPSLSTDATGGSLDRQVSVLSVAFAGLIAASTGNTLPSCMLRCDPAPRPLKSTDSTSMSCVPIALTSTLPLVKLEPKYVRSSVESTHDP